MARFQVHLPFLDQIKEKGLREATVDKADDIFTRVTTGIDFKEFRSMLRGEPAPRPNPRVKPHKESFWFHIRPTYYHKLLENLYPTFRLGWLATFFFAVEIVTGVYLMLWYTPSPQVAYADMLNILSNVPFGQLMRDLHRLGAEAMVAVVGLHMLRTFLTGSYKKPRQFTWLTGIVLLFVTLILSFSGYLLPWDQLSLWAVTIGSSMVEAAPPEALGRALNILVRGGPQFGDAGLLRFYLLHVIALPIAGIIAFSVHYYKVIIHGHSLPPEAEEIGEDTATRIGRDDRVDFIPDILTRELFYVSIFTAIMVVITAFFYSAKLEAHADPLVTPLHTTAPWYFLWLQGMLKLGDKVFWGLVVPPLLVAVLTFLPYWEVGPSRRYKDRIVGITIAVVTVIVLGVLTYMGSPLYGVQTSPEQEVVAALFPQTEAGPVRTSAWDELEVGTYEAVEWASAPTFVMQDLLEFYHAEITAIEDPDRTGFEGLMVIEDWQTDLKKITLRVLWEEIDSGETGEFSDSIYLHAHSNYGEGG
jgi:quinol-cytochrome oxidoreductase complex cytochrome b subunit